MTKAAPLRRGCFFARLLSRSQGSHWICPARVPHVVEALEASQWFIIINGACDFVPYTAP